MPLKFWSHIQHVDYFANAFPTAYIDCTPHCHLPTRISQNNSKCCPQITINRDLALSNFDIQQFEHQNIFKEIMGIKNKTMVQCEIDV